MAKVRYTEQGLGQYRVCMVGLQMCVQQTQPGMQEHTIVKKSAQNVSVLRTLETPFATSPGHRSEYNSWYVFWYRMRHQSPERVKAATRNPEMNCTRKKGTLRYSECTLP